MRNKNKHDDNKSNDGHNIEIEKDIENSIREENDLMINHLLTTVKSIKRHTQEIHHKVQSSNTNIDDMNKKYMDSNSLMTTVTRQLGAVFSANSNYWCYLFIFIFIVFFFLYKITH